MIWKPRLAVFLVKHPPTWLPERCLIWIKHFIFIHLPFTPHDFEHH